MVPSESAANKRHRLESDLLPGNVTVPSKDRMGFNVNEFFIMSWSLSALDVSAQLLPVALELVAERDDTSVDAPVVLERMKGCGWNANAFTLVVAMMETIKSRTATTAIVMHIVIVLKDR